MDTTAPSTTAPSTTAPSKTAPSTTTQRITSLDTIRGVAVLGILTMNVVSYGLGTSAYFNLDASSPQSLLDWTVGVAGEIFFDQKFMALFSMLFGTGIVIFADRAEHKGRHAVGLSLRRNALLLGFGLCHGAFWDGDVLFIYAVCAPAVLALRRLPTGLLVALGVGVMLLSPLGALAAQAAIAPELAADPSTGLGVYWGHDGPMLDAAGLWLISDFFLRAFGMMLLGIAALRSGLLTGALDDSRLRRSAGWSLGLGLPLAALGVAVLAARDFAPDIALVASIPNTLATIPLAVAYASLIILWTKRTTRRALVAKIDAVGRMALTNYLAQTALGLLVLRGLFAPGDLGRTALLVFAVGVWVLQLWWSERWLRSFAYGPLEWLWRWATYGRRPRLRRTEPSETAPQRAAADSPLSLAASDRGRGTD